MFCVPVSPEHYIEAARIAGVGEWCLIPTEDTEIIEIQARVEATVLRALDIGLKALETEQAHAR